MFIFHRGVFLSKSAGITVTGFVWLIYITNKQRIMVRRRRCLNANEHSTTALYKWVNVCNPKKVKVKWLGAWVNRYSRNEVCVRIWCCVHSLRLAKVVSEWLCIFYFPVSCVFTNLYKHSLSLDPQMTKHNCKKKWASVSSRAGNHSLTIWYDKLLMIPILIISQYGNSAIISIFHDNLRYKLIVFLYLNELII